MMEKFNIVVFDSTHGAIQSEKIIKQSNINARLIPVPSELSSGCGLCLKIDEQSTSAVIEHLKNNNVDFSNVYSVAKEGLTKNIKILL